METNNQHQVLPPLYVVSGGKGLAGDSVVQSILIQFPDNKIPVIIVPDILDSEKAWEIAEKAKETRGVIVHTMVNPMMRKIIVEACDAKQVTHFDLVGGLSDYLSILLHKEPISKPGLYRLSNIEYFQRIEAIEFTLQHDDGQHADKINKADIVLTGVSRSGKTPLSVYLAMFGWKVANVPLIPNIEPPDTLFTINPGRVFGLRILQNQLIMQRENRVKTLKLPENSDYISPRNVHQELDYAEYIFTKGGFTVIEVSNKPVESTANEILTILTDRFNRDDWQTGKGIKY